jgi:hypothetical protein
LQDSYIASSLLVLHIIQSQFQFSVGGGITATGIFGINVALVMLSQKHSSIAFTGSTCNQKIYMQHMQKYAFPTLLMVAVST